MASRLTETFKLLFFVSFLIILVIGGCANIKTPLGGPRDSIPPKVIKESPKNMTTNFAAERIEIEFDEYFKLRNEFTEISISPDLDKLPFFKVRKKTLEIKFDKPLEKNITYSINFGKAIADVNEGNLLKDYSYVLSTGDKIDSLSISGNVTSSLTREALKDVTVFIIPTRQDSLFGKKRANMFTLTDSTGNFKLKHLHEDTYRIYALKEEGSGDRIFNSASDQIGFIKDSIVLNKDITGIKLQVFKEIPAKFNTLEKKIENDGRILFTFNKPLQEPDLHLLQPKDLDAKKITEFSSKKDSALLWLPQLTFDSLTVAVSDKGKNIDTVILRRNKKEVYTKQPVTTVNAFNSKLKPKTDLSLTLSSPIASFDASKIILLEDSIPKRIQVEKNGISARKLNVKYFWKPSKTYIINIAESAFIDILGNKSKASSHTFSLDEEDNYGNITMAVSVEDSTKFYIVEWINEQDVVLRADVIRENTNLNYLMYPAAKYHIRVVYDENKNGIWDTGSVRNRKQPEKIWNYEKEITIRPNWDLEDKLSIPKDPLGP